MTSTSSTNGTAAGGSYTSTFGYACERVDTTGRGFLGFAQQTVTDPQTNIVQTSNFLQSFPYTGLVSSQTKTLGSVTLNSTTNTYSVLTPISTPTALPWSGPPSPAEVAPLFPYLATSVVASTDLSGAVLPTATTTTTYDGYGEPTEITIVKSLNGTSGSTQTTVNQYQADNLTLWYLGRLTQSTVTSTTPQPNLAPAP